VKRLFWLALGASAGVLAVRRLTQSAKRWTPEGLSQRAGALGGQVSGLLDEVRAYAEEREAELRDALELDGRHDAVDAGT
jgi:hypothetical protein